MDHIRYFEKRRGVDVGYTESNLHPANGEGRVGKAGIDKNYTLIQMIDLAYRMGERPNIIIKSGPNAKWYLKKFDPEIIDSAKWYLEIEKQNRWRDISRCTMYIINWE